MADVNVGVLIKLTDEISKGLKDIGDNTDKVATKFGGLGKIVGGTLKASFIGFGVAAGAVTAGLISSVKAASDAELETARYEQILKNSVKTMKNTKLTFDDLKKAAQETGKAYVRLGFDDEAAATTFAKFNQILGDTKTAQEWVAVTADYARLKNIDLESSTNMMLRAMQNGGRVAKEFQIDIKETAGATEMLTAFQQRFGGTAEATSKTFAVQMEAFNVQFQNLKETIGGPFLSVLTGVLTEINNLVSKIDMEGLEKRVTTAVDNMSKKYLELKSTVDSLSSSFGGKDGLQSYWDRFTSSIQPLVEIFTKMVVPMIQITKENLQQLGKELNLNEEQMYLLSNIGRGLALVFTVILAGAINGILIILNTLIVIVRGAIAVFKSLASIVEAMRKQFDQLVTSVQRVIDKIKAIPTKVTTTIEQITKKVSGHATGGLVTSGQTYMVGERGPELFTAPTTGRIVPNDQLSGGGGNSVNLNVYLGMYAGSEIEKRNIATELYKALVNVANTKNLSVAEMLGA